MEDLSLSLRDGEWQSLIIRICIFVVMVECFREKTNERDETRDRESDELGNQRRVCVYMKVWISMWRRGEEKPWDVRGSGLPLKYPCKRVTFWL